MTDKKCILAIDDSITQLAIYKAILGHQHTLLVCKSPVEALALLKTAAVDLVITDIEMPEMTGFEFIRKLRDDPDLKKIPVIVISSRDDTADAVSCGADDYVRKPVTAAELKEKTRTLLAGKDS
jgi:CheY-like chemotaxis protein